MESRRAGRKVKVAHNLSVDGSRGATFRRRAARLNILTITDYEGYDPEVNYRSEGATDSNRNLGLDYGSYPNAKSYTVGLNIGF